MAEDAALASRFRGVVFDLDGVVYLGEEVVEAAPAALDQVRALGVAVAFVTNNSYRPPDLVAEKLQRLGVKAAPEEVLTSSQALVRLLGGSAGLDGVRVMVVGGPGLRGALEAAGARLVDGSAWREAEVVAVGFDPDLTYARVRDATLAIRAGARFVGSNPDTTLPAPDGLWPGAGATLALLQASTGVRPEVAGKPERALLDTAAAAIGSGPYLMVGDRADTDLDGAHRLGWSTALVLTGVTRPADLPDLAIVPDHLLPDVGCSTRPARPSVPPAGPTGPRPTGCSGRGARTASAGWSRWTTSGSWGRWPSAASAPTGSWTARWWITPGGVGWWGRGWSSPPASGPGPTAWSGSPPPGPGRRSWPAWGSGRPATGPRWSGSSSGARSTRPVGMAVGGAGLGGRRTAGSG